MWWVPSTVVGAVQALGLSNRWAAPVSPLKSATAGSAELAEGERWHCLKSGRHAVSEAVQVGVGVKRHCPVNNYCRHNDTHGVVKCDWDVHGVVHTQTYCWCPAK